MPRESSTVTRFIRQDCESGINPSTHDLDYGSSINSDVKFSRPTKSGTTTIQRQTISRAVPGFRSALQQGRKAHRPAFLGQAIAGRSVD